MLLAKRLGPCVLYKFPKNPVEFIQNVFLFSAPKSCNYCLKNTDSAFETAIEGFTPLERETALVV